MGFEERGIILGIVFEVCVLDQHQIAARMGEGAPEAGPLAPIARVEQHAHAVLRIAAEACAVHALENLSRAVGGAVIDNDDFLGQRRGSLGITPLSRIVITVLRSL